MNPNHIDNTDVLIVGAGPTGLMMACQLAIYNIPFRIIEKKMTSSTNSGALIIQARTLEIFEKMGIAKEAVKEGIIANKINIIYNGKIKTSLHIKNIGENLSAFPFLLMLEQSKTEKLLIKFLKDKGHTVERNIQFKSFSQDDSGISSLLIFPDESEQTIKSKFLIAADGGNSTIRNFLNIPFKGITYPKPIFIIDCTAKSELLPGEISFSFSKNYITGFFSLSASRFRIDGIVPKEIGTLETITFDSVKKFFPDITKMNFKFQGYGWFSVTHSHQKYAATIRDRNCFLAGDAAHVNTPIGAQGMNTGLQDAYNLAWKLAFVLKSRGNPELLDTYQSERFAITKNFARYADNVFKIVTSDKAYMRFFRSYMQKIILNLLFRFVEKQKFLSRKFFVSISQVGINYRKSILSFNKLKGNYFRGSPEPGDRLPFIAFLYKDKKTNTHEIINSASFFLIVFADVLTQEIENISQVNHIEVELISFSSETKKLYKDLGIKNTGYLLIRPDMHIAMRSDTLNVSPLNSYINRFLTI
jgi:2-polyprenyl-6-methoxyphenol hydroxylase-like FAD-dependent oxidoreductase